jgi:hypothetical protein
MLPPSPKTVATSFYTSFTQADAAGMAACYHPEVRFSDPVFGNLTHTEVCAMWQMLLERSQGNLQIEFKVLSSNESGASVEWIARYPFGKPKRPVVNVIHADLKMRDGLIVLHEDHFDFWHWSKQALGWSGWLLGWTPFLRNKVGQQSKQLLAKYLSKNARG